MTPAVGERLLRFVGDRVRFSLHTENGTPWPEGWRVLLRTNLGRGRILRHEIIHSYPRRPGLANASWHDVPMEPRGGEWTRELTLTESGFFRAKAYAVDPQGRQHWPAGDDVGISVHPDQYRIGNTIYCAFIRMFGETKHAVSTANPTLEKQLGELDARRYTVIPPSGKIRDLIRELPFIINTLGCRIVQLLPVNPTPTTFARFGRFGSPYASQDLTAIDPALIEFDKRTTGVDQFQELTYAAHALGGRVFIDIVINHTGWGARLQETHPEWYLRDERGDFVSPGAWGVTWEDLAELDHRNLELWDELAETFLIWCRRGVDGFRCDAGYKVPLRAWRYITARVLDEFPDTIFLLEGLGGSWEATELLLTEGALQWAYSELFQNYSGREVAAYLEYALRQSTHRGVYIHYSETHDNPRLAEKGRLWSLLRNRLCALTSVNGGFGFTSGVEWLATERINVHSSRGLAWGNSENIVVEIAKLTELLRSHPCFFDGAKLTRITAPDSPVYALLRESADASERVLVVVNTDSKVAQIARFEPSLFARGDVSPKSFDPSTLSDLLGQPLPEITRNKNGQLECLIAPAAAFALHVGPASSRLIFATSPPEGPDGGDLDAPMKFGTSRMPILSYRAARARAAWGVVAISQVLPAEEIGAFDWSVLAEMVHRAPPLFLGAVARLDREKARRDLIEALMAALEEKKYPQVVTWELLDARRITLVPGDHWLLIRDPKAFRATLALPGQQLEHVQSIETGIGHVACFSPRSLNSDAALELERHDERDQQANAILRFLTSRDSSSLSPADGPSWAAPQAAPPRGGENSPRSRLVLLTNGRGGMARLCIDFGHITSKYDCLLAANLHPALPVDRHVLVKRARVWLVADGFISSLNADNLFAFEPGPPARWTFVASAGDGRSVEIEITAEMLPDQNTTALRIHRPQRAPAFGVDLPAQSQVSVTVRLDIEDRNFHWETKRNSGAEHHFSSHTRALPQTTVRKPHFQGFAFTPAADRQLRAFVDRGCYHAQPEWCENIPHPIEASRGQTGAGDAFSPGWFEIPLEKGSSVTLTATAEVDAELSSLFSAQTSFKLESEPTRADDFEETLRVAVKAFVVRRNSGKTVIAGYPWFLDWGRDSLITARGLISAGMLGDVRELLKTFGRFEENGTLPNTIHGENASNRDTTDAPLWFGIACEELAAVERGGPLPLSSADGSSAARGKSTNESARTRIFGEVLGADGRTIADVLRSIALNYIRGTPNGIRMDSASALVWSPSHFTWMDTNHPAGTPREGYPVEIQVLWIRLLRQLDRLGVPHEAAPWRELAHRAEQSLHTYFWLEDLGYFADVLMAAPNTPARTGVPVNALRNNCLFAISLGLVGGDRARRCAENAARYLIVPGALRSLAPLPVSPPLPIHGNHGGIINDPSRPYWGRYEGDEDTRRKPAYHNGTAWTWTLPTFCEALVRAWDFEPRAITAAKAYLWSMRELMNVACIGHFPEILDGDAPHQPRGCDAQAWSATEALRVWRWLNAL